MIIYDNKYNSNYSFYSCKLYFFISGWWLWPFFVMFEHNCPNRTWRVCKYVFMIYNILFCAMYKTLLITVFIQWLWFWTITSIYVCHVCLAALAWNTGSKTSQSCPTTNEVQCSVWLQKIICMPETIETALQLFKEPDHMIWLLIKLVSCDSPVAVTHSFGACTKRVSEEHEAVKADGEQTHYFMTYNKCERGVEQMVS